MDYHLFRRKYLHGRSGKLGKVLKHRDVMPDFSGEIVITGTCK